MNFILDNIVAITLSLLLFNFVISWLFRSKAFAIIRGVILTFYSLVFLSLFSTLVSVIPPFIILLLCSLVFIDTFLLLRPKMQPFWVRILINWPGQWFLGSTIIAFPWAIWLLFFKSADFLYVPYILGLIGVLQNFRINEENIFIDLNNKAQPSDLSRLDLANPTSNSDENLHIIQLTDPHLGPYMSVARLERICKSAVAKKPDLILLTGDFLTMESKGSTQVLSQSLSPLKEYSGKVFACMGNHDYEAPEIVKEALANNNIHLLIDEAQIVQTRLGPVQIIGFDFHFKDRASKLLRAIGNLPNKSKVIASIAMLHDPTHIRDIPTKSHSIDLFLSGHTHGGLIGLVSLGFKTTVISLLSKSPDHGLWGMENTKLYVHRGTGHYGFPFRLGVPTEHSVINVILNKSK
ncbi:phosphodiesterase [Photobacterium sp. GB-27]|uniref:metallophosphoesterase n=1 Tax=unclassified Photobacterium TaxID=2628852 RepID=UPI000D162E8C|nr:MULTISPECIES: metallophosphoesterase [unclassified Photobacterium]PSV38690.1 phosphodiesterase [Photobacterium sp. GB-27]PSW75004.1 phosphodiesterase [Photobacterium sp. GB-50]